MTDDAAEPSGCPCCGSTFIFSRIVRIHMIGKGLTEFEIDECAVCHEPRGVTRSPEGRSSE